MINIAFVDDNAGETEVVKSFFSEKYSEEQVKLYYFESAAEFQKIILNNDFVFDIILMDIEMPEINGIDLCRKIRLCNSRCRIIYLTNYIEFATDIFDTEPTSFVLKQKLAEQLPIALKRAVTQLEFLSNKIIYAHCLNNTDYSLNTEEIVCVEHIGRFSIIYLNTGESFETKDKLSVYEKTLLNDVSFFKSHRSYILNLRYIRSWTDDVIIMKGGKNVMLARSRSRAFKEHYMAFVNSFNESL